MLYANTLGFASPAILLFLGVVALIIFGPKKLLNLAVQWVLRSRNSKMRQTVS